VADGLQPPPGHAAIADVERPSSRVERETDSKDSSTNSLVRVHEVYM
jgi:hypothetical protein